MKKLIWAFILVIWVLLAVVGHADAKEEISENQLYAQAAVLMDASSGRVLYGKNADQVLAMASTTKIMTCIVALENAELSEMVEISAYASTMPKVKLGVRQGEAYLLEDLLYSLMLESHNDVAVAIAEHIGKRYLDPEMAEKSAAQYSVEESRAAVAAFAHLMNEKAKTLGCEDTYFITPNGLDAEEYAVGESGEAVGRFHSTTAEDLSVIMSYCIMNSPQKELFLKIVSVSGVGPKLGISVLTGLSADELTQAIATADVKRLSAVKGLGKKTAEKIVLELHGKISAAEVMSASGTDLTAGVAAAPLSAQDEEAISALMGLGFTKSESAQAVKRARDNGATTVEDVIRKALQGGI